MDDRERVSIPANYCLDIISASLERTITKLWVVVILLVVLLVGSNAAWIWYENQFTDEITETVETSTEGGGNAYGAVVSGDNNEVHYGESQSDKD